MSRVKDVVLLDTIRDNVQKLDLITNVDILERSVARDNSGQIIQLRNDLSFSWVGDVEYDPVGRAITVSSRGTCNNK